MKIAALALFMAGLAGCYSPMQMYKSTDEMKDGVIVFLPKATLVTYKYDKYVNPVTKAVSRDCEPSYKDKILQLPDVDVPYRVNLRAPVLGSSEYGVTLSNGILTAVNGKGDPKIPELITAIASAVPKGMGAMESRPDAPGAPPPGRPLCNDGERIIKVGEREVVPFTPSP